MRLIPVLVCASCATAAGQQSGRAAAVAAVAAAAEPIRSAPADYDALLSLVADNRFVLLGESTHGTREFYHERARITRRLIEEKGFTVVAVEADWHDGYVLNEFIHGRGPSRAEEALATFNEFPKWMWGNEEIRDLVHWMRDYNNTPRGQQQPVGIYGLDLYDVFESITEVKTFLERDDAAAAARAKERYKCFDPYLRGGIEEYGRDAALGTRRSCTAAAQAQFEELTTRVQRHGTAHKPGDEQLVSAWQSARVVLNGEAYYRTMFAGGAASWNLRDRHMADTIDALSSHLGDSGPTAAKVVVWAHNSHLGDARVTQRSEAGELNVGQLMRQRHDGQSVLVGLTTYEGSVRAASSWGAEGREQRLAPALPESAAAMFHQTGIPAFFLRLRGNEALATALAGSWLQRFVGVIYAPATERQSHYFETEIARQYDAVIHIDRTTAVRPVSAH